MDIKPVRQLDGNRVEMVYENKISKNQSVQRYFSVPAEHADEFASDFTKKQKNNRIFSLTGTGIAVFLGIYAGGKVAKKTILSWMGAVAGGLTFGFCALTIAGRQIYKNQQKLFDKYDVKQVSYSQNNATERKNESAKSGH